MCLCSTVMHMNYCTAQALCYRMCLNYCKCSTCWMDMKGMNKDASVTRREEEQEMELFREQRILHTPLCGVLIVYVLVLVGCEKKWSCWWSRLREGLRKKFSSNLDFHYKYCSWLWPYRHHGWAKKLYSFFDGWVGWFAMSDGSKLFKELFTWKPVLVVEPAHIQT